MPGGRSLQREDKGSKLTASSQHVMVRSPPLGQAQVQVQAQAPPEGPWRPCNPSPLVVVMVMATAVVVLAVFVVVVAAASAAAAKVVEEEVVGLDEVSVGKKESGSGNDVAETSPLCCQSLQKLTVAALHSRRIRPAGACGTGIRSRLRLRLRSRRRLMLLLLWLLLGGVGGHLHRPRRRGGWVENWERRRRGRRTATSTLHDFGI